MELNETIYVNHAAKERPGKKTSQTPPTAAAPTEDETSDYVNVLVTRPVDRGKGGHLPKRRPRKQPDSLALGPAPGRRWECKAFVVLCVLTAISILLWIILLSLGITKYAETREELQKLNTSLGKVTRDLSGAETAMMKLQMDLEMVRKNQKQQQDAAKRVTSATKKP